MEPGAVPRDAGKGSGAAVKYTVELLYRVELSAPSKEDAIYLARERVEDSDFVDEEVPEPVVTVRRKNLRSGGRT